MRLLGYPGVVAIRLLWYSEWLLRCLLRGCLWYPGVVLRCCYAVAKVPGWLLGCCYAVAKVPGVVARVLLRG